MFNQSGVAVWRVETMTVDKLKLATLTECHVLAKNVKEAIAIVGEDEGSIISVRKVCRLADLPGNKYIVGGV